MTKLRIISFILFLLMFLSSCSSVYITPGGSSDDTSVINADEYFTDGSLYSNGDRLNGFFYEGCWIYVESQMTVGPNGMWDDGSLKYGYVEMQRIVKYNPITGIISSPCLDPVCNHSFESGCIMLAPRKVLEDEPTFYINAIIGDWMVMIIQRRDEKYVSQNESIFYNLKTGEVRKAHKEDLGSALMTRWIGGSSFEGKYYNIKQVLDYSETEYDPEQESTNLLDYAPKTLNILCEYDIESNTIKELFEVPENYLLTTVSNKRFFFVDDTNVIYSCNRDGSNMAQEDVLNFQPENKVGTYAYKFHGMEGFTVYDLKTNKIKTTTVDYDEYGDCAVADDGILFDYVPSRTELNEFVDNREQFFEAHSELERDALMELYSKEAMRILYGGISQIFKTDLDGENMRLIYEEENAIIQTVYATGDYIFAIRNVLEDDGTESAGKCIINIKTGETTYLPLLEIVVPDWYVNK